MHWIADVTMSNTKPGLVYAVSGNGIFMTEDITVSKPEWKVASHGIEETVAVFQGMISIPDGPLISSLGDVGGYVHTDINEYPSKTISQSISFAYAPQKTSTIVRSINKQETVDGNTVKYNVALLSEDNGETWEELPRLPINISGAKVSVSADGDIILWHAHHNDHGNVLYWTENKGQSWHKTSAVPANSTPVPDGVEPLKFYMYNPANGMIYRSDDGAKTFDEVSFVGAKGGSSVLKFVRGKSGHIWINNAGKIRYSEDEGQTFTTCTNYSAAAFSLGKEAPDKDHPNLFIWGKASQELPEAMYRSTDKGLTWERANDDSHQWGHLANAGTIEADQNVYGRVFKSTAGMGIPWMGIETIPEQPDSIPVQPDSIPVQPDSIPEQSTNIKQNIISLDKGFSKQLDIENIRSMTIYNMHGQVIKRMNANEISLNSAYDFGLKKGVYLISITTLNKKSTFQLHKK